MQKTLILMRGAPGSGLSTAALEQAGGDKGKVFSPDDCPHAHQPGPPVAYLQTLPFAQDWNFDRVCEAMRQGISPIVVDALNLRRIDALGFFRAGQRAGYEVMVIEPTTAEWLAAKEVMKKFWAGETVDLLPCAEALAARSKESAKMVAMLLRKSDASIEPWDRGEL